MARDDSPTALLGRLAKVSSVARSAVAVAVIAGLVSTVALVLQAVALAALLGALFHDTRAGWANDVSLFLGATVLRAVATGCAEPIVTYIARGLRRTLRRQSLRRVLDDGPIGTVDGTVQLCTRGIDAIENYVAKILPAFVLSALAPCVLIAWLCWRDPLSAVIVGICVVLLPIFMVLLGLEAKEKIGRHWRQQQQLAGYFGDVVRGMTVLKSFNRSSDALTSLDDAGAQLRRSTMASLRVAFLSGFALELLSSLSTALVALVLGLRLLNGTLGLNVALAVLLVTPEVFVPLRRSAALFHSSANGVAAAGELLGELEVSTRGGERAVSDKPPSFTMEAVVLGHRGRRRPEPFNASIRSGELTTLVGPSGSGKSTLLRVLAGLRVPSSGVISVDGEDLTTLSRAQWRRGVAWLPQDPSLPGSTVADAVRLGRASVSDDEILEALARVDLHLKLDQPLGEGAVALSAGERRRVALARCLVRRPRLLLLDEPTSHLDEASARAIERAVCDLTMTRVVATHRPFPADSTVSFGSCPS